MLIDGSLHCDAFRERDSGVEDVQKQLNAANRKLEFTRSALKDVEQKLEESLENAYKMERLQLLVNTTEGELKNLR